MRRLEGTILCGALARYWPRRGAVHGECRIFAAQIAKRGLSVLPRLGTWRSRPFFIRMLTQFVRAAQLEVKHIQRSGKNIWHSAGKLDLVFRDIMKSIAAVRNFEFECCFKKLESFLFRGDGPEGKRTVNSARKQRPCSRSNSRGVSGVFLDPEGGKSIPTHSSPYWGYLRYHLALEVPKQGPQPRMRVRESMGGWEEGKGFLFDDSWDHELVNENPNLRSVLIVDIARPMGRFGRTVHALCSLSWAKLMAGGCCAGASFRQGHGRDVSSPFRSIWVGTLRALDATMSHCHQLGSSLADLLLRYRSLSLLA